MHGQRPSIELDINISQILDRTSKQFGIVIVRCIAIALAQNLNINKLLNTAIVKVLQ